MSYYILRTRWRDEDVVEGVVLFLDPETLRAKGARCTSSRFKQVRGGHYFICMTRRAAEVQLIPASSKPGAMRVAIDRLGKRGHPGWASRVSYAVVDQVWTVSCAAVIAAAYDAGDLSQPEKRNTVTLKQLEHLQELAGVRVRR